MKKGTRQELSLVIALLERFEPNTEETQAQMHQALAALRKEREIMKDGSPVTRNFVIVLSQGEVLAAREGKDLSDR